MQLWIISSKGRPVNQSFAKRYQSAVRNLLGSLPDSAGTSETTLSKTEKRLKVKLPIALREYYLTLGNLDSLNQAHNRLLAPKDWFLNEGKLVFLKENQGVLYWGIETTPTPQVDPPVLQGVNHLPKNLEWYPEHDRCSEFLLVMIHWSAVSGGLEYLGTTQMDSELAEQFVANWKRVGGFSDLVAYQRKGCAACFLTGEEEWQLFGARSEELLQEMEEELSGLGVVMSDL